VPTGLRAHPPLGPPPLRRRRAPIRRILVQLCKHAENPVSSSLPACRDTTCTEQRIIEACITCTCTNFGPQNMGRKSNVGAHTNWDLPIKVLTSVNNAPWYVARKSVFYPPIELHGHRGSAWRVIKCLPLASNGLHWKRVLYYALIFPSNSGQKCN
jgi:hypothetical protein